MKITVQKHTTLADTITPIIAYQRIREVYAKSILFECAAYQDSKNSNSIIVFDELASVCSKDGKVIVRERDEIVNNYHKTEYRESISAFMNHITIDSEEKSNPYIGIYGFTGYNSVSKMEDVNFREHENNLDIPDFSYGFYRFTLVFHHHTNTLKIYECLPEQTNTELKEIVSLLQKNSSTTFSFESLGEESCNGTKEQFLDIVKKAKQHSQLGDTFQMVLSRQFKQSFAGDDFNVYRSLRSLNPSPYLFYADFGDFKLIGSSPEAQIVISDNTAEIHPIAGTFKRKGEESFEKNEIERIKVKKKENDEKVRLME